MEDQGNNNNPESPDSSPPAIQEKPTDMGSWDLALLGKFKDDGLPNVSKVSTDQIEEMFNLYMNGDSYKAISQKLNIKKPIVLYFSEKQGWFEQKTQYLQDMAANMGQKLAGAKLESMDHLINTVHFFNKYYGEKFKKYAITKDDRIADSINTKFMPHMFKAHELLQKIATDGKESKEGASVNVNIHGASSVTSDGQNLDIKTSNPNDLEAVFSILAKMKREAGKVSEEDAEIVPDEVKKTVILKRKKEDSDK